MTAHAVVRQVVTADVGTTFDVVHDCPRRLEWDTLLRSAELVGRAPLFADWAASIRHRPLSEGASEVVHTLTFRCRPAALAWLIEPVARAAFRVETRRRLRALAAYLAAGRRRP